MLLFPPVSAQQSSNPSYYNRSKRPTITDVVRISGFSIGSVSRAFNNSPLIHPATREKILKIAREIGYYPHAGARLIKASRTKRWGILLPDLSNPYYAKLFEALDAEALRRETFIQSGLYHNNPKITETLITCWSSGEVDGLIADSGAYAEELLPQLKQMGFPVIFIHGRPSKEFDVLHVDHTAASLQSLALLQQLGHRRVAYVGTKLGEQERHVTPYLEWLDWMRRHGQGDPETLCYFVENSGDGGMKAWRELRARGAEFTAVIAYNDIIACGLIQSARADGVSVPKDLSVIGNDDIEEGRRMGLTTMRHDLDHAAKLVFQQLELRRQGDSSPPVELRIESQFIMRDSVGAVR